MRLPDPFTPNLKVRTNNQKFSWIDFRRLVGSGASVSFSSTKGNALLLCDFIDTDNMNDAIGGLGLTGTDKTGYACFLSMWR